MNKAEHNNLITDFTSGNVPKQLMLFAAPLFLSNLLQIVYNMSDMIIVGRTLGKIGLSSVSVGGDVTNFLTFLAMGFSSAGQVIISQYIGADQKEKLGKFVGTMFSFSFICAALLSVFCLFFRIPILRLMNTPQSSWAQTLHYSTICIAGLIFIYGYNMISAVLRGMGDSRHPFIFISFASILNIILDLLFVAVFSMEAKGAALATVISQGTSFFLCALFLFTRQKELGFSIHAQDFIRLRPDMLSKLVALGIPMAIKSASVQFSKLFVNSWINSYGVSVSAVAGIAGKLGNISNLISNAVNNAGSSMIGQNIGAQKYKRVPMIMKTAFIFTLGTSAVLSVLLLKFPEQIFRLFTSEREVLDIAMQFLPIAVLVFFGSACRAPMNALINGSGNYKINFFTAVLDGFVLRIGLSLLFGLALHLGYLGFWLGDALASFTPFWLGTIYYISGTWKTREYVVKE